MRRIALLLISIVILFACQRAPAPIAETQTEPRGIEAIADEVGDTMFERYPSFRRPDPRG